MKILNKKFLNNKGFSLIEIIISLVILSVLIFYGYSSISEYYRYENALSTGIKYSSIIDEINGIVLQKFEDLYSSKGAQRLPIKGGLIVRQDEINNLCNLENIEDTFGNIYNGFSGLLGTTQDGTINVVSSWTSAEIEEDDEAVEINQEQPGRLQGENNFNYEPREILNNQYWAEYNRCKNREHATTVTNDNTDNRIFSFEFCVAVEPNNRNIVLQAENNWISMQPIFINYTVTFTSPIDKRSVSCQDLANFDSYLVKVDYTVHWINYHSSSGSYKDMMGSFFEVL